MPGCPRQAWTLLCQSISARDVCPRVLRPNQRARFSGWRHNGGRSLRQLRPRRERGNSVAPRRGGPSLDANARQDPPVVRARAKQSGTLLLRPARLHRTGFTSSEPRGTVHRRSSSGRTPRRLSPADRFQSWGAHRSIRRSAVCPRCRLVFRRPSLELPGFQ